MFRSVLDDSAPLRLRGHASLGQSLSQRGSGGDEIDQPVQA
jgi:hypothetical protein